MRVGCGLTASPPRPPRLRGWRSKGLRACHPAAETDEPSCRGPQTRMLPGDPGFAERPEWVCSFNQGPSTKALIAIKSYPEPNIYIKEMVPGGALLKQRRFCQLQASAWVPLRGSRASSLKTTAVGSDSAIGGSGVPGRYWAPSGLQATGADMRVTSEGDNMSVTKGAKRKVFLGPSSPARRSPTCTSHSREPAGPDVLWFGSAVSQL